MPKKIAAPVNAAFPAIVAAMKAKAPIIGIPTEKHAPVCIRQKLLSKALKGVTIVSATIERDDNGKALWLRVDGTASEGRVKTRARFALIEARAARKELSDWARKEAEKLRAVQMKGATSSQSVKAAKLAAMETALQTEAEAEKRAAQEQVHRIASRPLGKPACRPTPEDRERYASACKLWRSTKRLRGQVHGLDRKLRAAREGIAEMSGRRVETKSRRRGPSVQVWKGRKRKLKTAEATELIQAVQALLRLRERREALMERWPTRTYGSDYDAGVYQVEINKPKAPYPYGAREPIHAPDALSFDRPAWKRERIEAATLMAEALRVLRAPHVAEGEQRPPEDAPHALAA